MTKDKDRKRPLLKVSLDPSTAELLGRVGNASRYLDAVVGQRWQDWQWALRTAQDSGWSTAEILATCDALNGTFHEGPMPSTWLQAELADATSLNGLDAKWAIEPKAWKAKLKTLAGNEQLSHALWTVAREFWAQNDELERRVTVLQRATIERLDALGAMVDDRLDAIERRPPP